MPNAQRLQYQGRNTREHLLMAASELMTREGTANVSLHAIVQHAGVTAPLVKYYFGSKEGLFIALAKRDTGRSIEQLRHLVESKLDPVEKLRIHIHAITRTYSTYPYLNSLLNLLLRGEGSAAEELRDALVRPLADAQRQLLEEGVASGHFKPVEPELFYFLVIGACQYLFATPVIASLLLRSEAIAPETAEHHADLVVEIVTNGLLRND
ncbi:TetR family transcriptional regulator [Sphingobium sp.]|uniref:TetR family transcriptional regulator n=1 Tax=Sphingobium sp. TaxID=1912891 RepID=UPI0028BF253F|nr:TetR family transcriptional regulator [Sphingobium sp.]